VSFRVSVRQKYVHVDEELKTIGVTYLGVGLDRNLGTIADAL